MFRQQGSYDGGMSEQAMSGLPSGIALAWGLSPDPQRGPKRALTIEQIVDAAVALADEGGLAAVSMNSVAKALGFTPMSLYRYVSSKDDLLMLMQDHATGGPPASIADAAKGGWRAGLTAWAHANLAVYRRHPWILDIPPVGGVSTPQSAAWLDAALGTLASVSTPYGTKISIVLSVMAQVRWQANVERSYMQAAEAAGASLEQIDAGVEQLMRMLVRPEVYPHLAQAVASGAFTEPGDPFAYGLERVLDGIERDLSS